MRSLDPNFCQRTTHFRTTNLDLLYDERFRVTYLDCIHLQSLSRPTPPLPPSPLDLRALPTLPSPVPVGDSDALAQMCLPQERSEAADAIP